MIPAGIKKLRAKRDEGEYWHLTLADMMTLLLCFFVIIVSISAVDLDRYADVAASLGQAMGTSELNPGRRAVSLSQMRRDMEILVKPFKQAVEIEQRPDGVALNLRGPVFFNLGDSSLTPAAMPLLDRIAEPLKLIPYRITIEGHTDDLPIATDKFPSNWDLSAARASTVARYLIERGVPKTKIQVLGLADTRPLAPNLNPAGEPIPENRAKNRRVAVLLTPPTFH